MTKKKSVGFIVKYILGREEQILAQRKLQLLTEEEVMRKNVKEEKNFQKSGWFSQSKCDNDRECNTKI